MPAWLELVVLASMFWPTLIVIVVLALRVSHPEDSPLVPDRVQAETTIDKLLNGLSSFEGRVAIVLDDFHHARDERGLRTLVHEVEGLPLVSGSPIAYGPDPP